MEKTAGTACAYNLQMLRSLIAGVLALSAVPACGKSNDVPAVVAGATAGNVIAAEGDVTATRGSDTRKLVAGDAISGDDEIKTASGASVRIWLSHNNATWSLEENRAGKVGESAAWRLARVDKVPEGVDEATTAAGRYAEKSAADTSATARNEADTAPAAGEPTPAPGSAPPAQAAAVPAPTEPRGGGGELKQQKEDDGVPDAKPAMDRAPKAARPTMKATAGGTADTALEKGTARPSDDGLGGGLDPAAAPPPPPPPTRAPANVADMEPVGTEIDLVAKSLEPRLRKCLEQATLLIKLEIVDNKLVVTAPRASAKELRCMSDIAKGQKIAGPNAAKPLKLTK
jgi:hypothetical protein